MSFRDIAREIEELGQQRQITADEILNLYQQLSKEVKQQTGRAAEDCKIGNIGDFARLLAWEGGEFSRIYEANRAAVCEFKAFFAKKLDEMKAQTLDGAEQLRDIEQQEKKLQQKQEEVRTYHAKIAAQTAELERKKQQLTYLQTEADREREACEALKQDIERIPVPRLEEARAQKRALEQQLEALKQQTEEQNGLQEAQSQLRQQIAAQTAELERKKQELTRLQTEADREREACEALEQEIDCIPIPNPEEARAQKHALEQQLEALKQQTEEQSGLQEAQSQLRQQIAAQTAELERKKQELMQQKQLAEEEQGICDGLAKQLSRLETIDLPAVQARRTELEQQVEQLGLQIAEQTVVCDREAEKKQQAETELNQLQTETRRMLVDTEELLGQIGQLHDEKLAVTSGFEAKQTELEQLKGEFSRLRAEYQQLLSDVQERTLRNEQFRQGQLAQARKDCAETEQKLQDMQNEVQQCRDTQNDLIQRTDAARAQKSKLLEECDIMQISVELAEKSREEQQMELDRLTSLKQTAETAQKLAAEDCAGVHAKLEELEKQTDFLLEQKPILEQKLEALTTSLQNQQTEYENRQAEAESRQNELSEMTDKQQAELDGLNANIDRLKERSEQLQDSIVEAEKKLREWESDGEKKKSEFQNLQSTLMELQNAMASDEYQQQTMRLREIHSKLRFLSSKFRNLSEESEVISAQSGGRITAFDVTADVRAALEETDAKLKQIGERMNEYEKVVKEDLS